MRRGKNEERIQFSTLKGNIQGEGPNSIWEEQVKKDIMQKEERTWMETMARKKLCKKTN
jgi:hypothetical protein